MSVPFMLTVPFVAFESIVRVRLLSSTSAKLNVNDCPLSSSVLSVESIVIVGVSFILATVTFIVLVTLAPSASVVTYYETICSIVVSVWSVRYVCSVYSYCSVCGV